MGDTKRKKAVLRLREAIKALETEIAAVKRELDEADETDETPTVRPPSGEHSAVQVPKVEIVKIPRPGRY